MRVPLLDVRRQNAPLEAKLRAAFARVLESGHFILGPEVECFEEAAASIAGARFAVGMSSGTDALLVALMALGIGSGDEVICPSFTFFATAGCIARARLLRNHGAGNEYIHSTVGGNFRLDAVQAALLGVKLPLLAAYTAQRQQHACEYRRLLRGLESRMTLPVTRPDRTHIVNQFTL